MTRAGDVHLVTRKDHAGVDEVVLIELHHVAEVDAVAMR
jgi:hypothetical protein